MKRLLALAGFGVLIAALGVFAAVALAGGPNDEHKVVVCKYVGTPGVDERLQTGGNPIVVDYHALGEGFTGSFNYAFADAQGNSMAVQWTDDEHFSDLGVCPAPPKPTKGVLVVKKVVVNDDGGTKTAGDFAFTLNGEQHSFDASGFNSLTLEPGDYAVTEVAGAGYASSIDDGSATIVAGETTTVTITNDDLKGVEPTDVCPNIAGNPEGIPPGMVKDAQGNCGTPTPPPSHEVKGDASVSCILPDGHYSVSGTVDGQAAEKVDPATIPGNTKGSTEVTVTRGDSSVKATVSTNGDCGTAPTPPVVTPPAAVVTPPVQTAPTTPTTTTEPTAPLAPPTATTKKPTTKKPAVEKPATKTAPAAPKKAVAGAFAKEPPKLAYTP